MLNEPLFKDEPFIHYVNDIIKQALALHASDIHIEPQSLDYRIRYRRDGLLHPIMEIKTELAQRIIMRLKVIAQLDITEYRFPQDGRLQLFGIDIRINICPTIRGEKIVLRLLDHQERLIQTTSLGMSKEQLELFIHYIEKPHGLILVTGPTGCGKTVTLYSALNHLNSDERNIITLEDPVEIQLAGINQVSIQPKIGLDYHTLLRTFLRQDPDVIMIGEIRDQDTAYSALKASTTGHLVLSTLHSNNALETFFRLQAIGIQPQDMAHSLSLIVAQRLVRKLCDHCKIADIHTSPVVFYARGCTHCHQGYQGRIALYEMLPITAELARTLGTQLLKEQPVHFQTLYQSGLQKVLAGTTTQAELNRVLFT